MEELSNAARKLQLESEENQDEGIRPPTEPQTFTQCEADITEKGSKRSEVNNRQTDGQSKDLHGAVRRRDSYGIQRILISSDNNTVNAQDEASKTALHVAVQENCLQAVQLLLRGGADPSLVDNHGNNALHYACANNVAPPIVQELLDVMAPDQVTKQNAEGSTSLMLACEQENLDLVQCLLDRPNIKLGVNFVNNQRQTALHLAAQRKHTEIVRLLIQNKASVNRRDCSTKAKGDSALHIAVRNEDAATVKVLLAANADPGIINIYGETSLYMAAKTGSVDMVQLLLGSHDDDQEEQPERPRLKEGVKDALVVAIRMGNEGVVRVLLRHFDGLDLKSALLAASMAGNEAIMTSLLTHVSSDFLQFSECVDCCCQSLAQHAVILATRFGHLEVLRLLAEAGCPIDIKFSCSRTLLHEAALNGHDHIARYLLHTGVKINSRDYFGRTPLMDAVCSNKVDIIRTIVEYVEAQGTRQRRSSLNQLGLGESAIIGQCTERPWKFKNSKTIELLNAVDYAGNTYMHMAAGRGHVDVVKYLLTCGCPNVNSRDAHMSTPLHTAAHGRRLDVVECLIQTGSVLDPEDSSGMTPLVQSIRNVDLPMVIFLLNSGCDVTKIRSSLQPPVTYGLVLSQPTLIAILIAAGALQADIKYLTSGYHEQIQDDTVSRFLAPQPLSLKFLARIVTRKSMVKDMTSKTKDLPLPELMKSFILMQEYL